MDKGKVININSRKNLDDIMEEEPQEQLPSFEEEKAIALDMMSTDNIELVARFDVDAMALAEIILENDDSISHVEYTNCSSRIGNFIKIKPIPITDTKMVYANQNLGMSYIKQLEEDGRIEYREDGIIINRKQDDDK